MAMSAHQKGTAKARLMEARPRGSLVSHSDERRYGVLAAMESNPYAGMDRAYTRPGNSVKAIGG